MRVEERAELGRDMQAPEGDRRTDPQPPLETGAQATSSGFGLVRLGERAARPFVVSLAGLGLAIAPRWMFSPELESGAVVPILRDWSLPPVDLWAVHPAGRMPSAKARAFISWYETVKPD